jgi:hypothetical protein
MLASRPSILGVGLSSKNQDRDNKLDIIGHYDMIIASVNLLPWRTCDNGLFLFDSKIKTPQVLGIREDPGGCNGPRRTLGALLFLRKGQKNAPEGAESSGGKVKRTLWGNFSSKTPIMPCELIISTPQCDMSR